MRPFSDGEMSPLSRYSDTEPRLHQEHAEENRHDDSEDENSSLGSLDHLALSNHEDEDEEKRELIRRSGGVGASGSGVGADREHVVTVSG